MPVIRILCNVPRASSHAHFRSPEVMTRETKERRAVRHAPTLREGHTTLDLARVDLG